MSRPDVVVSELAAPTAADPSAPVVVVGPSLGTRVDRLWGAVAAQLDGFRVVGWDLPGHGLSPRTSTPFDLAGLATAVLRSVDSALGGEAPGQPYLYAGDSVGGAVGLQLALDHAERVAAVAVLCSAARFGTPEGWSERAALVRAEGLAPLVESAPDRWFGSRLRSKPTDASRAALDDLAAVDPESYALACDAIGCFDATERVDEITTPLLAVAGADDVVTPAAGHQELAARASAGRFAVLRGVGHLAPLEDPARTAALLREHFSRVGTSA